MAGTSPIHGHLYKWNKHIYIYIYILVGGLEHFLFSHILGIIIPTDFHIFERGRAQPPTSIYRCGIKWYFVHCPLRCLITRGSEGIGIRRYILGIRCVSRFHPALLFPSGR